MPLDPEILLKDHPLIRKEKEGRDKNFNQRDLNMGKFHLGKSGKNGIPFHGIIDLLNIYLNRHHRDVLKDMFTRVGYFLAARILYTEDLLEIKPH